MLALVVDRVELLRVEEGPGCLVADERVVFIAVPESERDIELRKGVFRRQATLGAWTPRRLVAEHY